MFKVVVPPDEAQDWEEVAFYAFWLRHSNAIDPGFPAISDGLRAEKAACARWGQELAILEDDLTQCLNEFLQAYQVLYRDPLGAPGDEKTYENLGLMKFSILSWFESELIRTARTKLGDRPNAFLASLEELRTLLGGR